ncbi:MAG: methyl-accepting chemotaxis protein [Defluviitaleaceae bacterium]|nr:methyl-accepting chemotaxis protein [Defluviitaleaceae bacterium]
MKNEKKLWLIEQYAQQAWTVSLTLAQEAARAGEFGKGYAMLAHEARTLANRLYDYTAKIKFETSELANNSDFKGIIDFARMTKFLSVNASLELIRMSMVSMDFNIPKSMAVFANELRQLAINLEQLNEKISQKPFIIPEVATPSSTREPNEFFLYTIGGQPLLENVGNILEIHYCKKADLTGETLSLRGKNLPIIDFYKQLNLAADESEMQTIMIIKPTGIKFEIGSQGVNLGDLSDICAVPIDELDVNAIVYSVAGRDVPVGENHAFHGFSRECWDFIGGEQVVFVDWAKIR